MTGRRFSLAGRIAFVAIVNVIATALLTYLASRLSLPSLAAWALALLIAIPFAVWSARRVALRITRTLSAVEDGIRGFRDGDFSVRLAQHGNDEVSDIVTLYNAVGEALRAQRNEIYQKELLLDTILQRTPIGVLLVNAGDRIIYSNAAARELFAGGARLDGHRFEEIVAQLPAALREALSSSADALFPIRIGEQEETFHLTQRTFHVNTQQHRLVLLERLTHELRRQEVSAWKNAIRLINHELNNTIAPVSSLVHSARLAQERESHRHRLGEIYEAIEERLAFLRSFLESYARFARLPEPRRQRVRWRDLLDDVHALYPFRIDGALPADALIDPAQIEQVLINLLKNAHESRSAVDDIVVSIHRTADGHLLHVADRGRGMDAATLRQALLPFYSTKPAGTGLGLALCTEIAEAHGGRLAIAGREGGGVEVRVWLKE